MSAEGSFVARIANPLGHFALANIRPHRSNGEGRRCAVSGTSTLEVRCAPTAFGTW